MAVVLPDAVGSTLASVHTDALLAAARGKVEASVLAGRHPSARAAVIPAAPVNPVIYIRAIHSAHIVLLVKVEGGREIRAVALVTAAAPLGQGITIDISVVELGQLSGQCYVGMSIEPQECMANRPKSPQAPFLEAALKSRSQQASEHQ